MHTTDIEPAAGEGDIGASLTPPMNTRWWIILFVLWTLTLVAATPLLLLPAVERPVSTTEFQMPDVTSVTVIQRRPILDWLDRHSRYTLEVMHRGTSKRYPWVSRDWRLTTAPDRTEISSSDGSIVIPLTSHK
jgi:hypothetical protein